MIHEKHIAIIKPVNRGRTSWRRAIVVTSRDGTAHWAREPESNLAYLPGAFVEEEVYELPESAEAIDALAIDLNKYGGAL